MKGEGLKFLKEYELDDFMWELENARHLAKTDRAKKQAIRNEAAFKLMYYLGLRVSEVAGLRLSDYDKYQSSFYCRRLKNGNNNTLPILDEEYDRYHIDKAIKKHISYNKPIDYLFVNFKTNQPLSRKTFDKEIKQYFQNTNIPSDKWHCHTLRHTRAIILAEAKFDLKDLMFYLGHKNVANTQIYFQFTFKQQQEMIQKMKEAGKKNKPTIKDKLKRSGKE